MQWLFFACAVCFGDPASSQAKGAFAGALFLLATVAFVLSAIGAIAFSWSQRAKKLH